jgi:hypothetical protein
LEQIDLELVARPDDVFLLDQKLLVLRQLRSRDPRYNDQALEFAKFRAEALPVDFVGLGEIIEILQGRGQPDSAWPFIDQNLRCERYRMSQLAADAAIDISDFAVGFTYAPLYRQFRRGFALEELCATLHSYGLSPDSVLMRPLFFVLLPVFGVAAQTFDTENKPLDADKLNAALSRAVATVSRIVPLFGATWLATQEPENMSEKQVMLTLGMCYLAEIVATETARQIGFLRGSHGITDETVYPIAHPDWTEIGSQIATNLRERVAQEWKMTIPDDNTDSEESAIQDV